MRTGDRPRPRITVVGLGPAGPELLTTEVAVALGDDRPVYLRTVRHPAAESVDAAASYDDVYDRADHFEDVYEAICADLVERAHEHGEIVYAVPGSPTVAERTVEMLRGRTDVALEIRPAMSFAELAWLALGIDPMASGAMILDGHDLATAAGSAGPFLVTQVHSLALLSDLVESFADGAGEVVVLQRLGLPDQRIERVAVAELLVSVEPDHLTSLYVERRHEPVAPAFERFDELVRRLRADCPWDRVQTHASLRKHLLEEAYEVLEALDAVEADPERGYEELEEELGDLLFQIFFHSRLAAEQGHFTVADVARGIHEKLHARHPHVFADADADETLAGWELAKQVEKNRESLLDGIPPSLPALLTALKVQRRAAATGFSGADLDWALEDIRTELAELVEDPSAHEVGDVLYACVQVARMLEVDPEHALREAITRFADRFRAVERLAAARAVTLAEASAVELDSLWAEAKGIADADADAESEAEVGDR